MYKRFLLSLFSLLWVLGGMLSAAAQPKYEVRAAWITGIYGLDWPKTKAKSPATIRQQKEELIEILDRLKEANFNTVLFQTRTRGDVLYRSKIEPFNAILTGKVGQDPGYDPLAFAVEECHKRGMECHAWIVSIPLGNKKQVQSLGNRSVTRQNRKICLAYKNEYFLNPGHPSTAVYLMSLVEEIVKRYDVDGVHFDYLRYPENAPRFPDQVYFKKYGKGRSLAQWRRDNLTEMVRYLYKGVKAIKPWVKVSTCPVGKYKDTSRFSSKGWNAFHAVYQDPQGWLNEGIQDQLYPMMYFQGNHFYPFALDWQEQSNGRPIIPGLGIYFLHPAEGKWKKEEVLRQLHFIRRHELAGAGFYRVQYLMENTQGIYDEICHRFYQHPALVPPMTWLDKTPPSAPTALKIEEPQKGYLLLKWQAASDNETNQPPMYVVYGSNHYPVDTSKAENILASGVRTSEFMYAPLCPWEKVSYFAITAIDRYGNESEPLQSGVISGESKPSK